jgi:hypothetical protein
MSTATTATLTDNLLTLGDVAQRLGCQLWQVARVIDRGLFPQPARVGCYRVLSLDDLPAMRAALIKAGFLKEGES